MDTADQHITQMVKDIPLTQKSKDVIEQHQSPLLGKPAKEFSPVDNKVKRKLEHKFIAEFRDFQAKQEKRENSLKPMSKGVMLSVKMQEAELLKKL